jgi:hypothetical protein
MLAHCHLGAAIAVHKMRRENELSGFRGLLSVQAWMIILRKKAQFFAKRLQ